MPRNHERFAPYKKYALIYLHVDRWRTNRDAPLYSNTKKQACNPFHLYVGNNSLIYATSSAKPGATGHSCLAAPSTFHFGREYRPVTSNTDGLGPLPSRFFSFETVKGSVNYVKVSATETLSCSTDAIDYLAWLFRDLDVHCSFWPEKGSVSRSRAVILDCKVRVKTTVRKNGILRIVCGVLSPK